MLHDRSKLPINQSRDHIIHVIKTSPVVLIRGETGCGKTTQVIDSNLETKKIKLFFNGSDVMNICENFIYKYHFLLP